MKKEGKTKGMRIRKRDGSIQEFTTEKIRRAILSAFNTSQPGNIPVLNDMVDQVAERCGTADPVDIEVVQDHVETVLMESSHHEVARHFIRYREQRAIMRAKALRADPIHLADYIHVAKYGRYREDLGRREVYAETVERDRLMHVTKYVDKGEKFRELIDWAFDRVHNKLTLPSMRSMQFGGEAILKKHERMYNCAFTLVDRPRAFQEILYLLRHLHQTVERDRLMHVTKYVDKGEKFRELIDWAFDRVHNKLTLPSMRSMQFGGEAILKKHERMYNCAFTLVDRPRAFQEILYLLLCGAGVGASIQWPHVEKLPAIKPMGLHGVRHHAGVVELDPIATDRGID